MTRGGNLTLIVVLLILWFVGIFLAGYFGYEHFDKKKKTETNLILFVLGVILAIGTFIGIIVLFIKRSRLPKNVAPASSGSMSEKASLMEMPSGYPSVPSGYPSTQSGYPAGAYPSGGYPGGYPSMGYTDNMQGFQPVAPMGGYSMNQQYSI